MQRWGLAIALLLASLAQPVASTADGPEMRAGLDDALADAEPHEPVVAIAVHERGRTDAAVDQLDRAGVEHSTLERVGVSQLLLTPRAWDQIQAADAIATLWPEQTLERHLDESAPMVGAPAAWERLGNRGEGATVLVVDTGVDAAHPDLMDPVQRIAQPHDPLETGLVPEGYTETDQPVSNDWFGHGTHVSGIVAGTGQAGGEASPQHERYVGVAPEADLAVWSIPGLGNGSSVFQAIQGFEYAIEKQDELGIDVITNSYGQAGAFDAEHPLNVATREAYRAGMAVVFSSGNDGEPDGSYATNTFSTAPWVIGVAASTKGGEVADFSSRGNPEDAREPWDRPDVIAPGAGILSAKSRTGALQALGPTYAPDGPGSGDRVAQATHYQYASGTSMSAPHVAGVLALIYAAQPDLSPDQAYDILVRTADPFDGELRHSGIGIVDAVGAVGLAQDTDGRLEAFLDGERRYDIGPPYAMDPVRAALAGDGQAPVDPRDRLDRIPAPGLAAGLAAVALASIAARGRKKR